MFVLSIVAVAAVCFILYYLDRRSKDKSVELFDGLKLSVLGSSIAAGLLFSFTGMELPTLETPQLAVAPQLEQEIFVGTPTF